MEEAILKADREILAEIVRITQKQGLVGREGGWKDFLNGRDWTHGSVHDPKRKSKDMLVAFLQTFQEKYHKFFLKMITRITQYKALEKFISDFPDKESPQQRLVRLTAEHPCYRRYYSFPSYNEEWIIMQLGKLSEAIKSKTMISIDCEMVLCEDGTEAVIQVCAVDENLEVKLDKLVNPNKAVADYRTDITGVSAKDLEGVTCSLADVQKSIKKLLSHGTILVGHTLYNDLQVLKIDHQRVVDTSCIFKYSDLANGSPSLNNLCKSVLGFALRKEGEPHNCLNDAKATMKLVLAKLEHGFDAPISVADDNLSRLLLHKIPVDVPYEDLLNLFPDNYNVDIKNDRKVRGSLYSTFAVFKDVKEADEAYRGIEGPESTDSNGRSQKRVFLEISTGKIAYFFVRKMTAAAPHDGCDRLNKWMAQDESNDLKRQRTCEHVKEIKKLKQEILDRENEIFELQMMVSALAKNKGISCIPTS